MIAPLLFIFGSSVGLGVSLGAGIVMGKRRIANAIVDAYNAGRKDGRKAERERAKRQTAEESKLG